MHTTLRLTEIFYSLQGESLTVGVPTVFVRLTGCPLRCQYCDTAYAFHGGQRHSIPDILEQVAAYTPQYVCVTGGEPLAQKGCKVLLTELCDKGYHVSLETSGAISIENVDPRVMIVMDLKTPDSKECDKNLLLNIDYLKPSDQIKFVICSRLDFDWAARLVVNENLAKKAVILFSPSWKQQNPTELAEWILSARLPVRMQMQLHKILWHDEPGR